MSKIKLNPEILFNFPQHSPQFYYDYPFDHLYEHVGSDVVMIIKKLLNYDDKNTRTCEGLHCHVKIYYTSIFFFCGKCFREMKREGFVFCKGCKALGADCFCEEYDEYYDYYDFDEDEIFH